ncbi:hypothetical protein BH09SUM1_BH09SUM1_21360 [soil metagenome]
MTVSPDVKDFISLLEKHRVKYVLIGGHAVGLHGCIRTTEDIDFFTEPTVENGALMAAVFDEFASPQFLTDRTALSKPEKMVEIGLAPNRIHVLTGIAGVTFREVWDSRLRMKFSDFEINVIGRDALRKNKLATGRSKDKADVELMDRYDAVMKARGSKPGRKTS